MRPASSAGRALFDRIAWAVSESAHYSRYNAPMIGILGVIGFPLYYYIWEYLFPQPYENLALRLIGAGVCIPLILYKFWPEHLKNRFALYWVFTMTYTLPFFFTYMLLQNNMSIIWSLSTMAGLFLLVLALHDWLLVIVTAFSGSIAAWLLFWLGSGNEIEISTYLIQLPIYLFVVIAGSIFNYTAQMVKEEKLDAYAAVGRNIAHELRTPLLGMKGAAAAINNYLPDLIQSHELALKSGLPIREIRPARFELLRRATTRIDDEIDYSNIIIDMMLLSAGQANLRADDIGYHSASQTIEKALARYPFKSDHERALVQRSNDEDFYFHGSSLLVIHSLFNLIKNSLHSVIKAGKGNISISTDGSQKTIRVRDTGLGIEKADQRRIFEHFYSSKTIDQGSGIGLSFCKRVMDSLDGKIRCESQFGIYTEFSLIFSGKKHEAS